MDGMDNVRIQNTHRIGTDEEENLEREREREKKGEKSPLSYAVAPPGSHRAWSEQADSLGFGGGVFLLGVSFSFFIYLFPGEACSSSAVILKGVWNRRLPSFSSLKPSFLTREQMSLISGGPMGTLGPVCTYAPPFPASDFFLLFYFYLFYFLSCCRLSALRIPCITTAAARPGPRAKPRRRR
ncbi:hypothetical protein LX32DRAFT_441969 [Colletotrichum zoysiae]|uniref:Uncharacterized protein n=1 Tax=Colletotrichum zoysiae TaxID=1216348 RepID=A0AAD9HRT6_9PEZI|nr:hypothetical protein LX32DRAFT_441969 [Colletotrichum zoysiae]